MFSHDPGKVSKPSQYLLVFTGLKSINNNPMSQKGHKTMTIQQHDSLLLQVRCSNIKITLTKPVTLEEFFVGDLQNNVVLFPHEVQLLARYQDIYTLILSTNLKLILCYEPINYKQAAIKKKYKQMLNFGKGFASTSFCQVRDKLPQICYFHVTKLSN